MIGKQAAFCFKLLGQPLARDCEKHTCTVHTLLQLSVPVQIDKRTVGSNQKLAPWSVIVLKHSILGNLPLEMPTSKGYRRYEMHHGTGVFLVLTTPTEHETNGGLKWHSSMSLDINDIICH